MYRWKRYEHSRTIQHHRSMSNLRSSSTKKQMSSTDIESNYQLSAILLIYVCTNNSNFVYVHVENQTNQMSNVNICLIFALFWFRYAISRSISDISDLFIRNVSLLNSVTLSFSFLSTSHFGYSESIVHRIISTIHN